MLGKKSLRIKFYFAHGFIVPATSVFNDRTESQHVLELKRTFVSMYVRTFVENLCIELTTFLKCTNYPVG
jgi:hypothetical protein